MYQTRQKNYKSERGSDMKVAINLNTITDIQKFTALAQTVKSDVRLTGKDENGNDWSLSAKSLFCSVVISAKLQKDREHTAHEVDWNTIYCECEEDIYNLIQDYVKI